MREGGKSKDRSQPENIIHVFAMVLKFDELFYNNISDLEKCITKIGLNNEKVIVFYFYR